MAFPKSIGPGPGVAMECSEANGLHLCEDQFLAEIVNPDTFEPVPDGEFGELVITTLSAPVHPAHSLSHARPYTLHSGRVRLRPYA